MPLKKQLLLLFLCLNFSNSFAQHLLGKVVSVDLKNQNIAGALSAISKAGNFQFSYKSDIVLEDKKVNISANGKTVKQLLDELFEGTFHYSEKGKYIILHSGGEKFFTISGYIQDGKTGQRISNVTVYEDQILASTLTNEQGYFKLPIRNKRKLKKIFITARKESYSESFVDLNAGYDQELVLPILPSSEIILNDVVIKNDEDEESSWASKFLLSSKQKIQNINIGGFIAKRPIQTSILPGIGTHGLIGSQVVNKFSLNLLGGYTAGVNGFEMASLFNINKGNVRYIQVAGIFNAVRGNVQGFEIAGISNHISGKVGGFQVAGISNIIKGKTGAVQVAGISNIVKDTMKGAQLAGVVNFNSDVANGIQIAGVQNKNSGKTKGVQLSGVSNLAGDSAKGLHISGVSNHALKSMKGMQFSCVYNYAKNMKGFQFGLVNIADSMDGFGLGLVNYYSNGYHKLVVSSNELQSINIGFMSGTHNIYSIISLGANPGNNKAYSVSYGIGKEINLNKRLSINTEIIGYCFYIGHWDYVPLSAKIQSCLTYKIHKQFELFAGPTYTFTETKNTVTSSGYMSWLQDRNIQYKQIGNSVSSWLSWQAGIRIF